MRSLVACIAFGFLLGKAGAEEFNVEKFGATPNDETDDTAAITAALAACEQAGGGAVFFPSGTFIVARPGVADPILKVPSNTTLRGEGAASVIKFAASVTNFWRMFGTGPEGCRNVVIRDLHLDGSNTHPRYEKGKTPEHNAGIYLSAKDGVIENVVIRDLLVENFAGDCVAIGRGCRNITVRDVAVRNFIRQGIQLAGDENARDYLVTGCQDLEPTIEPGGSTIHVEHARGLTGVIIQGNRCRRSILAGGVNGLIIRDNIVHGRIEGNGDENALVQGNTVFGSATNKAVLIQFGYADGLVVKDNIVVGANDEQGGIYVWGASRYNAEPSQRVVVAGNVLRVKGQAVSLNGVNGGLVHDNLVEGGDEVSAVKLSRCENVTVRTERKSQKPEEQN